MCFILKISWWDLSFFFNLLKQNIQTILLLVSEMVQNIFSQMKYYWFSYPQFYNDGDCDFLIVVYNNDLIFFWIFFEYTHDHHTLLLSFIILRDYTYVYSTRCFLLKDIFDWVHEWRSCVWILTTRYWNTTQTKWEEVKKYLHQRSFFRKKNRFILNAL